MRFVLGMFCCWCLLSLASGARRERERERERDRDWKELVFAVGGREKLCSVLVGLRTLEPSGSLWGRR
jgi:hypothetical protein